MIVFLTRPIQKPTFLGKACIAAIKFYKLILSPLFRWNCRFYPTCSSYALSAYQHYGVIYASYLSAKRLLKCQPFHPGGVDPLHIHQHTTKDVH